MIRQRKDFSILHAHSATSLTGLFVVPIAKILHKKIVIKVATAGDLRKEFIEIGEKNTRPSPLHRLLNRIINRVLRLADAIVCISQEIVAEAKAVGLDEKKLVHLPNGIEVDTFTPVLSEQRHHIRQSLHLPLEAPIILYSGRFIQRKGIDILLSAWPQVRLAHPTAQLALLGGASASLDEVERSIANQIRQLGPNSGILALGEQSDVLPYLRAATAFVFPSRREGLSNALLEAMSTGLPSVASSIGGNVDVIKDGESGLLYDPESAKQLSQQLIRLIGDQALQQRLGASARQEMQAKYSLESIVPQLISLYSRLLSS